MSWKQTINRLCIMYDDMITTEYEKFCETDFYMAICTAFSLIWFMIWTRAS